MAQVMIVEDDFEIRGVLADLLTDEGHAVLQAANGAEALAILSGLETLPGLILLDLMMPVKNGWQFIEEQRRDPRLASIPVVIVSADDDLARKAADLKVHGFFRKPIDIEPLLEKVADFCGEPDRGPHPADLSGART